jgi:hypothetical protein
MKDEELTLTQSLERIFTIDGRGRPAKAKLMLELMTKFDMGDLVAEIQRISERKSI